MSLISRIKNKLTSHQVPPSNEPALSLAHVWTEEPNAVKFQVNRTLMSVAQTWKADSPSDSKDSPLAAALFEIPGVTGVELQSPTIPGTGSIKVLMDDEGDWDAIMVKITETVTLHLSQGRPVMIESKSSEKKFSFGFQKVESRTPDEQKVIVQNLLENEINPAIAAHGGQFQLIDVKENTVYVELGGGCQGCGQADVTLREGVETRLRQVLPEMVALVDITDHASGQNPYYTPEK